MLHLQPADAGESPTMKLKLDDAGHVVVQDNKPVYVHEDGKEAPFDAVATVGTITRLNGEAKAHREAKEKAETALKAFEGIEDPEAARKALETVSSLGQGELLTAGKVDEIKKGVETAVEAKYQNIIKVKDGEIKVLTGERDGLASDLDREVIGGNFARSPLIAEKTILTPKIAEAYYGKHYKREDGKLVAYDANGTKIFSRSNPGQPADFDESMEVLIGADPSKDHILKSSGASGSGAQGSSGSGSGNKTISRAEFDKLAISDPAGAAAKMKEGFAVIDG
jgi:hypothetical protein